MKFPRGKTAEGHTAHMDAPCSFEAGNIGCGKKPLVLRREGAVHLRAHGMHHKIAGQVEGRGNNGFPRVLQLAAHDAVAGKPELHAGKGVDGIVDAAVIGMKAAQHAPVCRVHHGTAFQSGDIPLPDAETVAHGHKVPVARDAAGKNFLPKIRILHLQKLRRRLPGLAYIEKRTQKTLLRLFIPGKHKTLVPLLKQHPDKVRPSLCLRHIRSPSSAPA